MSPRAAGTRGRGRRPGGPDTRGQILASARKSFADKGFAGTTIRAVAAEAGVDPALVHHYFGSKDDLFLAALEIRVDPREVVPRVFGPGLDGAAERLLRVFLAVWDDPQTGLPLVALVAHQPRRGRGPTTCCTTAWSGWCSPRCVPCCRPTRPTVVRR